MYTVDDCKLIDFTEHGDDRGKLVVVEGGTGKHVPFDIKRAFYIYGTQPGTVRGDHANKLSQFCLINVCGSCIIKVTDQNLEEKVFTIDKPHVGLYMPQMLWKTMYDFSSDCILLILSSEYYDKAEYIYDFQSYGVKNG